jgi:hypothetical protein
MVSHLKKAFHFCLAAVMFVQLTGCGTLMHPERKGQKGGSIDVGIALLDGLGLLFFLIPGIIAYAVDFSNGTIYLPNTSVRTTTTTTNLSMNNGVREIKFDPKKTSVTGIEKLIADATGKQVSLTGENTKITKLKSTDDMMLQFAKSDESKAVQVSMLKQ